MKTLVVFAAVCCLAAAVEIPTPYTVPVVNADSTYINKQMKIYQLFWHVDQPTVVLPDLYNIARAWSIEDNLSSYTNQAAVREFITRFQHGMLPRQEIFSVFYPHHREDAHSLFNVFYYAKDFATFFNTAVWARFNVNEKLFTYALSVAIIHRPDTKFVKLPPLYEMMPHYFFNNEVLQQVYRIKMGDVSGAKKGVSIKHHDSGVQEVTIHANYSGWYMTHDYHSEEKLSYFTEDVGLNSFYFYFKNEYPFWLGATDHHMNKEIRGETYYFGHQQLLARYYMERLSNSMGEIEDIGWHEPIIAGFHPTIVHPNGLPFPHRPTFSHIPVYKYKYVHDVEHIENRISSAIDSGYILDNKLAHVDISSPEKIGVLGNIIEGNADSINYQLYDSLDHVCKKILGFNLEPVHKYQIVPSALENFVTSVRDPIFYRIYKKIVGYFIDYKTHLPKYTKEQLNFPGVKIESVTVDKLTTYFDNFDAEISNVVPVKTHQDASDLNIKVRQHRLNHKPFSVHVTVNSDKPVKAMVRIFLGPKYDVHGHELDLIYNWMNFVEIDQYPVDLVAGTNKLEHSDHESHYFVSDEVSGYLYWKKLVKASETNEKFTYQKQLSGFPNRLILPKGTKEGMPFKLFVSVNLLENAKSRTIESPVYGLTINDGRSMGYPLDRPIHIHDLNVPNVYWKDVLIYHKQAGELNLTV